MSCSPNWDGIDFYIDFILICELPLVLIFVAVMHMSSGYFCSQFWPKLLSPSFDKKAPAAAFL